VLPTKVHKSKDSRKKNRYYTKFFNAHKKGQQADTQIVEKKIENRVTGNISKYAELTETVIDAKILRF